MLRQHPYPIQSIPSGHEPNPEFNPVGYDLMTILYGLEKSHDAWNECNRTSKVRAAEAVK